MSLEKQIRDAWKAYKQHSYACHDIANRVKNRKRAGVIFAFPEEIKEYDKRAKELKEIESYIAVRQKWLNRNNPRSYKENYEFNNQQIERLRNEFIK